MRGEDASRVRLANGLKSRLARLGLRAGEPEPGRTSVWVNSICILFLLIGVAGSKPAKISIPRLPPIEAASAAIVVPLPPQPPPPAEQVHQDNAKNEARAAPQVVVVAPPSPKINFSVPTIGNLVAPNAIAHEAPLKPLSPAAPSQLKALPLNSTGGGGERPQPPYPKIALEQGQQGKVVLMMNVDASGIITTIAVKESSGYPVLDRSALDFVKRHWVITPASGERLFEATINYRIQRS